MKKMAIGEKQSPSYEGQSEVYPECIRTLSPPERARHNCSEEN
jgi:hypothetical protein